MNCKQAQRDIALFVGHDLDDRQQRDDMKRHVAACPECREHYRQMKGALKVLTQADAPATYTSSGSLWPELSARINDRNASAPRGRFNGWTPFVAMTAACFILMLVVNDPGPTPNTVGPQTVRGPVMTQPVMSGPLFRDTTPSASLPFELRTAAEERRRLEEQKQRDESGRF